MIKTVDKIIEQDEAGFVAFDLARLYNLGFSVDRSIVLTDEFFQKLFEYNEVSNRLRTLLKENQFDDLKNTITNLTLNEELNSVLSDAIDICFMVSEPNASNILKPNIKSINIIASPNYITDAKIYFNVDFENLFSVIKDIIADFFSEREEKKRRSIGLNNFKLNLVFTGFFQPKASVFGFISKDALIKEFVFPGLFDFNLLNSELSFPDIYYITRDNLRIRNNTPGKHEWFLSAKNSKLVKIPKHMKPFLIPDNKIIEIARLIKKANVLLEKSVSLIFEVGATLRVLGVFNDQQINSNNNEDRDDFLI